MKIDLKCTTSSKNDTGKVLSCIAHMQEVLGFDCANFTFELEKKEVSIESIAWPVLDYIPQQTASIKAQVPITDLPVKKKSEKAHDREQLPTGKCAICGVKHTREGLYCSKKCYNVMYRLKNLKAAKNVDNAIDAGIETPVVDESKSELHPSILPSSSVTKSPKDISLLNEKLQRIRETIPIKRTAPELKRDFS